MNAEIRKYVAQLLETYHKRARQIAILRYELANPTTVTEKEMIDAMQFARPEDSGHPSGHISNKTFHIAMNYREQADRLNTESLWEISRELEKLMEEQSRLEYYVSLLEPQQAKVLRLTCFERVRQEEAAEEVGVTIRRIQKIKAQAIDELAEMYALTAELK